jgi:diguanylate cyclase (GGDEF)-like protein
VKILIADDEATSRLIAKVALEDLGHECRTVNDGVTAWEAFRSERPDVVISDWVMPGLTGLELCRRVRTDANGPYTYYILVTGQNTGHQIIEGMKAGADDYLIKPLDLDDLQGRLIAASRVTSLHQQLARQRGELERLNSGLSEIALRDPLTGLGNRRALDEDLELLEARVGRYGHSYCMVLIDVDHFKAYNDTYGHQAGDEILRAVATELKHQTRGGDSLYRYGGEEFLCIFPEQTLSSAAVAVERMRSGLQDLAISHVESPLGVLTLSAGLATLDVEHPRSPTDVLKEADEVLYRAKKLGRNRVEHAVEGTPVPIA